MEQDRRQLRMIRQEATRRRRARARLMLGIALAALVVVGVGAFAWTRAAASGNSPKYVVASQGATITAPSKTSEAATQAVVAEPSPAPPKDPAQSTANDVVAKAAVRFPNAPAVKPASISQLKPKHKYIAITIDDGYGFQPEMLALLQKYDARCTTFILGSWAASNKSSLKKLDAAGFEIANHTWDHKLLSKVSSDQQRTELLRTQKVISAVTGNQAPYMRPPGGATNPRVKGVSAELGYTQILWNRSFGDSGRGATPQKLYENVVTSNGGVKAGDIILCHWGSKPSYEAMKIILPELKSRGFEFVTVSELIADSQGNAKSSKK